MTDSPTTRVPPPKISQEKAWHLWRTLVEIGYSDLDAGPTPQYVRDHAKEAVQDVTARKLLVSENQGTEVIVRESDGAVFIRQDVAERAIAAGSSMAENQTTRLPVETKMLIESVLFHFWNCDGGCGMLHSALAKLAAHIEFDGGGPGDEKIAAYIDKHVSMTMEIHDD